MLSGYFAAPKSSPSLILAISWFASSSLLTVPQYRKHASTLPILPRDPFRRQASISGMADGLPLTPTESSDVPVNSLAWGRLSTTPELLSIIFVFCLPKYNMMPESQRAPVLLTRICRYWRKLALNTPELWSRLRLRVPFRTESDENPWKLHRYSEILNVYLARSGAFPLSLDLHIVYDATEVDAIYEEVAQSHATMLVSSILPHVHRWRHLSVTAPFESMVPLLTVLGHSAAPRLESLLLDYSNWSLYSDIQENHEDDRRIKQALVVPLVLTHCVRLGALSIFGDCDQWIIIRWLDPNSTPSLSNIVFWNVNLDIVFSTKHPNSGHSARRSLYLPSSLVGNQLQDLLLSSPLLEELAIFEDSSHAGSLGTAEDGRSLYLPNLHTLRLGDVHAVSRALDNAVLPSLAHLEYIATGGLSHTVLCKLGVVIQRSRSPLTRFVFYDCGGIIEENHLLEILSHMPYLTEFRCSKAGLTDRTLEALTDPQQLASVQHSYSLGSDFSALALSALDAPKIKATLCPDLTHITFSIGSAFTAQRVIDLILSRRPLGQTDTRRLILGASTLQSELDIAPNFSPGSDVGAVEDAESVKSSVIRKSTIPCLIALEAVVKDPEIIAGNQCVQQCVTDGMILKIRDIADTVPGI